MRPKGEGYPMRRLWLPTLLIMAGTVWASERNGPSAVFRLGPGTRPRIIGASVSTNGNIVVVLEQVQDDISHHRLLLLHRTGKVLEDRLLKAGGSLQLHHRLFVWNGEYAFGWVEAGKGLVAVRIQDGAGKTETVIPDDPNEGTMGEFWILDVAGQQSLLVTRHRYIQAEGQQQQVGKQYAWVYWYDLGNGPTELLRKVCVEDKQVRSASLICASNGKNVLVWQTVYEKGSSVQTVRVAEWMTDGGVVWRERYTGNEPLDLVVDPSCGDACMVQEWKSPEDASGILCCLRVEDTRIIPVGIYGKLTGLSRGHFLRMADSGLWAVAQKNAEGVRITLLSDDLTISGSERISGKGIDDFVLADGKRRAFAIFVQKDWLSVWECGNDTVHPTPACRAK